MKSLNNTSSLWTSFQVEELEKREEYTGINFASSIHPTDECGYFECSDYECCDYCCNYYCTDHCCDLL
jgi:hypothetical protein